MYNFLDIEDFYFHAGLVDGCDYYDAEVPSSTKSSIEELEIRAHNADKEALLLLGRKYYNGDVVPQDFDKARKYYSGVLVVDNKNKEALLNLSRIAYGQKKYSEAALYLKDLIKKMPKYNKKFKHGLGMCYFFMGRDCFYPKVPSEENYIDGIKFYRKAVQLDNQFAENNLGNCYCNGVGVLTDYSKAVELFNRAANQDNATGQYNLGMCYAKGLGVKQDYKKAAELYRLASKTIPEARQYYLECCRIVNS